MSPSESYSQFDLHELTGVLSLKQVLDAEDRFLAGPFLLQVLPQLQTSLRLCLLNSSLAQIIFMSNILNINLLNCSTSIMMFNILCLDIFYVLFFKSFKVLY